MFFLFCNKVHKLQNEYKRIFFSTASIMKVLYPLQIFKGYLGYMCDYTILFTLYEYDY